MRRGSYQVEISGEGMMTDDVEDCLTVVIEALAKAGLAPQRIARCVTRCLGPTAWDSFATTR
jgi:hypothetical protein